MTRQAVGLERRMPDESETDADSFFPQERSCIRFTDQSGGNALGAQHALVQRGGLGSEWRQGPRPGMRGATCAIRSLRVLTWDSLLERATLQRAGLCETEPEASASGDGRSKRAGE